MQYANLRHKAAHSSYIHNSTIEVNAIQFNQKCLLQKGVCHRTHF